MKNTIITERAIVDIAPSQWKGKMVSVQLIGLNLESMLCFLLDEYGKDKLLQELDSLTPETHEI